eukprot:CAMPEP_0177756440 /NCGR_PEP_ID=MMETSP0491_2-20121128/3107_1 /TAXON_ID=63592 /ORGANISM="Tetraselmis chuii, Strain PLY429" /LENGTH=47 /DNA_ID= /DNA_START= /DNA_END= /DNA_ORIENTATION=
MHVRPNSVRDLVEAAVADLVAQSELRLGADLLHPLPPDHAYAAHVGS